MVYARLAVAHVAGVRRAASTVFSVASRSKQHRLPLREGLQRGTTERHLPTMPHGNTIVPGSSGYGQVFLRHNCTRGRSSRISIPHPILALAATGTVRSSGKHAVAPPNPRHRAGPVSPTAFATARPGAHLMETVHWRHDLRSRPIAATQCGHAPGESESPFPDPQRACSR